MKLLDIIKESEKPVDEQLGALAKVGRATKSVVLGAIDDVLKFTAKDGKVITNSAKTPLTTVDDVLKAIKAGNLSATGASQLASGLLKTNKLPRNLQIDLVTEIAAGPKFKDILGTVKTEASLVKRLKTKGYTDETIELFVGRAKDQKLGPWSTSVKNVSSTTSKTGASTGKTGASSGKGGTPKPPGSVPPISTWQRLKTVAKSPGKSLIKGGSMAINVARKGYKSYGFIKLMTWLAVFGIGGIILYDLWKKLIGGSDTIPTDDELIKMDDWVNCILQPLQDDDSAEIVEAGDEVGLKYSIAELGGVETGGHVIFYSDHTIKSANGKTGQWSCNQSGLLNEQSGGDMTASELSSIIDELDDQLSGDFFESDSTDMMDALNVLKGAVGRTYKGKDAISIIKLNYPKIVGMSLEQHANELSGLNFEAIEAREEFMSILGSSSNNNQGGGGQSGDSDNADTSQGDGNPNTGLSHLTITWDSADNDGGGAIIDNSNIKFKPCGDFPFDLGCINDKIKELQTCLNKTGSVLKVDGYYGKKTHKDLLDMEMFADGDSNDTIITKVMFDNFMKRCDDNNTIVTTGDTTTTSGTTTGDTATVSGSTTDDTAQTVEIPVLDTKAMIDKFGAERLENIKKMTVDGRVMKDIMNEYLVFRSGRYILKGEVELTENQLYALNRIMSGRGYVILKDKEKYNSDGNVESSKYVWVADRNADNKTRRDIRRNARKNERASNKIDRVQNRLDDLKSKTYDGE